MQKVLTRFGFLVCFLLAGCAQEETATPDQEWAAHFDARDLSGLIDLYTDNAVAEMYGQILTGRGQIAEYWGGRFQGRPLITQLSVIERIYDRDRILINGHYTTFHPQPNGVEDGTFFQLWITDGLDWYIQEERWERIRTVQQ